MMMRLCAFLAFAALPLLAIASHDSPTVPDSSDCQSAEFVPTSEFQPVCEGQAIPAGLHVRMNLQTGQKEARLPNLSNDDAQEATDAVVVVANKPELAGDDGLSAGNSEARSLLEKSGKRPPAYSNVGKILPPIDGAENEIFESSVAILLSPSKGNTEERTMQALEDLEELSHDLYYGVEVAKNAKLIRALLELVGGAGSENIRAMAPLILGNAIQNSPTALEEIRMSDIRLTEEILSLLEQEKIPRVEERLIFTLGKLVKTRNSLNEFLNIRGLQRLLKVFAAERTATDERDGVRRRCAVFITDSFLDADMNVASRDGSNLDMIGDRKAQQVLDSTSKRPDLNDWCNAFEISSKKLKGSNAQSDRAGEAIEAAHRFPACQS